MAAGRWTDAWQPEFEKLSGSFGIFSILGVDFSSYATWPDLGDLTRLAAALGAVTATGAPLTFVPQAPKPRGKARRARTPRTPYESDVLEGRVPTRFGHWHDFFNALCWCLYPKTKAALNARQVAAGHGPRTPEQNLLAMFDEGGIARLRTPRGEELYIVGHAIHEATLRGQTGITGFTTDLYLPDAEPGDRRARLKALDAALADRIVHGSLGRSRS